jgi:putative membrane protein
VPLDRNTRWAADRTFWAADRTVIAWIRTAISMIGFGITIGKAGDALETQGIILDPYHSLQVVGVALIALAVLGLIGAVIQDLRIERRIARQGYSRVERTPLGLVMAILVLVVGIFGAFVIFL